MNSSYLDFLKYCLCDSLSHPVVRDIDWMQMMEWAEQQTIVGIIYGGIQRAGKALSMPFEALMEWVGYAQQIEMQNRLMNRKCMEVVREYQEAGYDCMVLKGQGNAQMYPNPMMRMPGDIDVWIYGAKSPTARLTTSTHINICVTCSVASRIQPRISWLAS